MTEIASRLDSSGRLDPGAVRTDRAARVAVATGIARAVTAVGPPTFEVRASPAGDDARGAAGLCVRSSLRPGRR